MVVEMVCPTAAIRHVSFREFRDNINMFFLPAVAA